MAGRRFTREQKIKIGREAIEAGNASLVGRRYQSHGTVVARWAKALQQDGEASFHEPRAMNTLRPDAETRMLTAENERLKKLLGEKDLEIAILKDLVKKTTFNSTRLNVAREWISQGHWPGVVSRALELNRSTYYYCKQEPAVDASDVRGGRAIPGFSLKTDGAMVSDEQIKEWICETIAGDCFAYGYLKLTWCPRRQYALVINKKKVYRLCKQTCVLRPQRTLKRHHPRRLTTNREVAAPNQLWETDVN